MLGKQPELVDLVSSSDEDEKIIKPGPPLRAEGHDEAASSDEEDEEVRRC